MRVGFNALLACLLRRCLASPAPPRPNLVRRWRCPMQHQEHDRHEADGEHRKLSKAATTASFSVAETPGDDDVDRHRYAGKPEYGGEGYPAMIQTTRRSGSITAPHFRCSPGRRAGVAYGKNVGMQFGTFWLPARGLSA